MRVVIFDLDGTILDTLTDLHNSLNHTLREFGLKERTIDETRRFVGNGILMLIRRATDEALDEEKTDKVYKAFVEYYGEHSMIETKPYDGIKQTIDKLRGCGYKTAVVSNKKDQAVKKLVDSLFPDCFDYVLGEKEQEGVRKKPAPDMVELALKELEGDRENSIYIGDSEVDVETARNSGIPCISVLWGFRTREELEAAGASVYADDADMLLKQIENILPLSAMETEADKGNCTENVEISGVLGKTLVKLPGNKLDASKIRFIQFTVSSLASSAVDMVGFIVFCELFRRMLPGTYIYVSTALARTISVVLNYHINYNYVFRSDKHVVRAGIRFVIIAIIKMCISAFFVNLIVDKLGWYPEIIPKCVVDLILFIINYIAQKLFVF